MIAGNAPATVMIRQVPLLCPSKRQLLPQGMTAWEPDAADDGDLDDLIDGRDGPQDEDADGSEPAA